MERENRPTTADIAGRETGDARRAEPAVADTDVEQRPPEDLGATERRVRDSDTDTAADSAEVRLGGSTADTQREPSGDQSTAGGDRRLLADDATSDVQRRWQQIQGASSTSRVARSRTPTRSWPT